MTDLSAPVREMLTQIARDGGKIEFPENAEPFPWGVVSLAKAQGFLRFGTDGAAGVLVSLTLTKKAWHHLGLRPPETLWTRVLALLR